MRHFLDSSCQLSSKCKWDVKPRRASSARRRTRGKKPCEKRLESVNKRLLGSADRSCQHQKLFLPSPPPPPLHFHTFLAQGRAKSAAKLALGSSTSRKQGLNRRWMCAKRSPINRAKFRRRSKFPAQSPQQPSRRSGAQQGQQHGSNLFLKSIFPGRCALVCAHVWNKTERDAWKRSRCPFGLGVKVWVEVASAASRSRDMRWCWAFQAADLFSIWPPSPSPLPRLFLLPPSLFFFF